MMARRSGIHAFSMLSALGSNHTDILRHLFTPGVTTLTAHDDLIPGKTVHVGAVQTALPVVPDALSRFASRNLQLALAALMPIQDQLAAVAARFPLDRLGIVLGTSTSGISAGEAAMAQWFNTQTLPAHYHYAQQEMGALAPALQYYLGWQGPAYCISTACSASAKAMASGQRLLQSGLCDAVLVGGIDSLCRLTLNGFDALASLSATRCRPLSRDRDGINIGEGAALFLLTLDDAEVNLLGAGEYSDAWHISAPHPEGRGAEAAMQRALHHAGIDKESLHYLNLHATGTPQNDAMEARAVHRLFGDTLPVSGTKHLTGHCLGAAGAVEGGIAYLLLANSNTQLPLHADFIADPELPPLQTTTALHRLPAGAAHIMSNSFAFGGSNIALILGRD